MFKPVTITCFVKKKSMKKSTLTLFICLLAFAFASKAQNNYNEISLPELMKKKQLGDNNMVIVDVRTNGEYYDSSSVNKQSNIGRIKGTIHIELHDLQKNPEAVKQLEIYKDKDVYLICSHSYRSRSASTILLKNGFTHVNNVQGGMTEWYRRYDELFPYITKFYETNNNYTNTSPSQLFTQLSSGEKVQLIGINNTTRFFWDSSNVKFYRYYPSFKNAAYFNYADSLKILELAKKVKGQPIVLFNMVNNGGAETAEWLTQKGIPNVAYLVGNANLFYEYILNKQLAEKADGFITTQSNIRFITPVNFCGMQSKENILLVDLRHDSLFNKINKGTKHDFKHLKGFANFFAGKGDRLFENEFSDKQKEYVFISENGTDGLELADALTKKGYKVYWLIGGLQRWEWYMNNVEDFRCNDLLIK